jgi:hypothetical protein
LFEQIDSRLLGQTNSIDSSSPHDFFSPETDTAIPQGGRCGEEEVDLEETRGLADDDHGQRFRGTVLKTTIV